MRCVRLVLVTSLLPIPLLAGDNGWNYLSLCILPSFTHTYLHEADVDKLEAPVTTHQRERENEGQKAYLLLLNLGHALLLEKGKDVEK